MAEGPLKTGLLNTSEYLKKLGVRETTLPPLDMSRLAQSVVSIGDLSGLVPGLDYPQGWGGSVTPAPTFNAAIEIYARGGGLYIDSMCWEAGGSASQAVTWFVYGPEATRMTAGFTSPPIVDVSGTTPGTFASEMLVGEINPAGQTPAGSPMTTRQMGTQAGGFFLPAGRRLNIRAFAAVQVLQGWVSLREVPST